MTNGGQHSTATIALQPVFDMACDGRVGFFETALRITNTPDSIFHVKLLALAEELGFIHLIDMHVLGLAVATLKRNTSMRLSINVSQRSILEDGQQIIRRLAAASQVNERIIVEITESSSIPTNWVGAFAAGVREVGCLVAIDDFETGYADDVLVRAVRPSLIKLVIEDTSPRTSEQIRRTVSLAREIGAEVVGEKIDSEEKRSLAMQLGVRHLQGYLLGRPVLLKDLPVYFGNTLDAPIAVQEGGAPLIRLDSTLHSQPLHGHAKIRLVEKTGS